MKLICNEFTSREIAALPNGSISTIARHRKQLMIKTGLKNTVGVTIYTLANGMIKKWFFSFTLT
jgi:DNA-binding CsgD family transcriptional regulator